MKTASVLLVNAAIFIALGIAFGLYGPLAIDFFGVLEFEDASGGLYWYVASFARLFGAALIGYGFLIWAQRDALVHTTLSPGLAQRALFALLLGNGTALFVTFFQQATVWGKPIGWALAFVFLVFTAVYAFLLATSSRPQT